MRRTVGAPTGGSSDERQTMQQDPGRPDPWAGFARGEDHEHHDPVQARFDTYRGLFWTHVRSGSGGCPW